MFVSCFRPQRQRVLLLTSIRRQPTEHSRPRSLVENLAPLLFRRAAHFGAGLGDGREILHPFVGPAGVNDGARAVPLLPLRDDWVERAAPTAADDLDVNFG